jgi:glycosyltransferase involved in cell wall biosynthesis
MSDKNEGSASTHAINGGRLTVASVCRLLPTPDDPTSGVFVQNRLRAMAELMDVHVVQPVPYFPILKSLPAWTADRTEPRLSRQPMFYVPRIMKSLDARWLSRAISAHLAELNETMNLDLVDAHFGYPDGVGCLSLARELDVPMCVTLRGVEAEQLTQRLIGAQLRRMLREVDRCICVSHFLAQLAIRHGADESRVEVIHNAIDSGTFFPGDILEHRHKLDLPTDRPIITSVGHLIERKRHDVLVRAASLLRERFPDVLLVILGSHSDERYTAKLKALIAELNLTHHVRLLGTKPQPEVADFLRSSNAFAMLSSREGCCNAVLEALACGIPVVATDAGDNQMFIRDGINGYIVPVDDPATTANALSHVLERTWNATTLAASSGIGSWQDVARRVADTFARVVQGA